MDIKQDLISKIEQIVKDEKFKIDAFYFCGFPGGTPNEKLKKACEKYLETKENPDATVKQQLIEELEKAVGLLNNEKAGTLVNNSADIKEILDKKEYL